MTTVAAVVGLGYVGLPLVIEFGKTRHTIGFDIDVTRVARCRDGNDPSREISNNEVRAAACVQPTRRCFAPRWVPYCRRPTRRCIRSQRTLSAVPAVREQSEGIVFATLPRQ